MRLILVFVLLFAVLVSVSVVNAETVSIWTFNGPYSVGDSNVFGDPDHNYQVPVSDNYGTNDGWLSGILIPVSPDAPFYDTFNGAFAKPHEGKYAWRSLGNAWDYFSPDSITGFSTTAGTYMWAFRANQFTSTAPWTSMLGTHLYKTGTDPVQNPMRIEMDDSSALYIAGGPVFTERVVVSGGSLHNHLWHTIALTYADGENVKIYVDGVLRAGSIVPYFASEYSSRSSFFLGNRTVQNAYQGDYDYLIYDDQALTAAQILQYHQFGYGVICDGKSAPVGDLDFDCLVDIKDIAVFVENWLQCSIASESGCIYGQ